MTYQPHFSKVHKSTRARCAKRLYTLVLSAVICSGAAAQDFVPFVIPARPNPASLIAVDSARPINTDTERLVVSSGHFYRGGERVRLWGVNLSFGANLPAREDAPYVAARLAAAGVNAVRCHHTDTAQFPRGLWDSNDARRLSPEALDRLDYFIDQLARYGIYVNINLHIGRVHSQYLGLPKTNSEYDKISNIFTPALIDAQKQYARELLTHVNKYRKVRYADDPAVAIVEITNENSLFMWDNEKTLQTLPPYYADILRGKFNAWLKVRYGSDEKLRQAWGEGAQPLGDNILANAHSPWDNLGLSRRVELTQNWQTFRFGFVAGAGDDNARLSFAFGGSTIPVYLENVEFRAGGLTGLQQGESIGAGNVTIFSDTETPARSLDRMCFLAETEKAYFDGMRNFIKNELGCKALVTGTIVFGPLGLYAQSDMDFIDAHAYWQHPRFPGRPWDSNNWLVDQKPMTDYPDEATLFRLAAERLFGKPFTVSEYNHPAPLDSQA
ncbi:MAG: cellulase family glycosylhydrolase, partial [Planctomycetota bacterium]|nr:cellulase family glycosylhydrolase [Planctomycetota bacterium]